MIKKALVVGIDDYCGSSDDLEGCVKDAEDIASLLSSSYSEGESKRENNFSCTVLVSEQGEEEPVITRTRLKKEIELLFDDKEAEVVLFYFAGHGFESSLGGYLVTQDARSYEEGLSFNYIMNYANKSTDKEIFIILDCCRSGNLGDTVESKNQFSNLRRGISILTASNASQDAIGTPNGGIFTQIICNALRGGSADLRGHVTFFNLYRHVERILGAWEQRPTFKVNTGRSVVLRKVEPKVPIPILSNITEHFPQSDYRFKLGPEFEPAERIGNQLKERQFSELQVLANNGLVSPVREEHMYYAAIRSKSCELTLLGKQYWSLVNEEKQAGIER
jgi:hypothetical protein